MDRLIKHVIACLALVLGGPSWAFYMNLEPPTNWIPKHLSPFPGYAALIVRSQTGVSNTYGGEEEWERARRCSALWTGGTGYPMGSGAGGSVGHGSGGGSGVSNTGMWWRPGCDGPAFLLVNPGTFRGIRTSSASPYGDPWLDWLWRMSPGAEAQAFVPAAVYAGSLVSAALRIGGRTIFVPAFLKYAPGAGREISKQVWRGAAISVVATLLGGLAGYIWDDLEHRWKKPPDGSQISDGFTYSGSWGEQEIEGNSYASVCSAVPGVAKALDGRWDYSSSLVGESSCRVVRSNGPYNNGQANLVGISKYANCPSGWYHTPAGCIQTPQMQPVPEDEFITETEWIEWPEEVPEHLPDGLPVESPPKINPIPSPWDPPSPFFDPDGDPVRNPRFNPDAEPSTDNPPWLQPGRRIKPAPTTDSPWQVDVEPVEKPVQQDENGKPLPEPEPKPDPTKEPGTPPSGGGERPDLKPSERQPLLCEVFPWILACAKLDVPPDVELGQKEIPLTLSPDSGWGGGGACPEPRSVTVSGHVIPIPFDLFCQFMEGIRPVIIAMAWLSAAFIVVGGFRQGD